jgi:predicted small integral membrane protein
MSLLGGYMFAGVEVFYTAFEHRTARVRWICDQGIPASTVNFSRQFWLGENSLYFEARSRRACPVGVGPTPTPPPRYLPVLPKRGPTATPEPLLSPNPHHVLENDTHLIVIDWAAVQGFPVRGEQEMGIVRPEGLRHTVTYFEWSSWQPILAPPGFNPGAQSYANMWHCWLDEAFESYCPPVADRHTRGSKIEFQAHGHFDSGLYLTYAGVWQTHLKINITCNRSHTGQKIPLTNRVCQYQNLQGEGQWSYKTDSYYVCPFLIETGQVPGTVRAAPQGQPVQTFSFEETINGQRVGLNLKKFDYIHGNVIIGYDVHYHWAQFHYSPVELIGCPSGKNCGIYAAESANVWKCVGRGKGSLDHCFPAGDKRYNVSMGFINPFDHMSGIWAFYGGGAGGYTARLSFQCNRTVKYGEIALFHLADEFPLFGQHFANLYLHTPEVCPGRGVGEVRGGAIFLTIVSAAFIAYFVLGTLILFIVHGTVSLPNESFWQEVGESLTAAIMFLVCCGKGQSGEAYKDI